MKGNTFQTALLIGFGVLTALGFGFFAMFKGKTDPGDVVGNVVIWGTLDPGSMRGALETLNTVLPKGYVGNIAYAEKDPRFFNEELVEALATGAGPDIFIMHQADIVKQINKTYIIPYENYSLRRFKDTYIEGAEIFLHPNGVVALPFLVDPLVMYWNRDILTREGIAVVPQYWHEFFTLSPKLTKVDDSANILRATVPFGEYTNVQNAKEIVSALMLQTGAEISKYNRAGNVQVSFGESGAGSEEELTSAVAALRYYTEFSNPIKSVYSWNRALDNSKKTFLAGDLAFYFGFASEIEDIQRGNPNLNFDIAPLPQIKDDPTPSTFGNMYGFAITRSSRNRAGSIRVAALLSSNTKVLNRLEELTFLPPITRGLLSRGTTDDVKPILYQSALISRGWLEPDRERSTEVFKEMVESVSSGRHTESEAIQEASGALINLIP